MKNKSLLLLTISLGLALAAVWLLTLAGFGIPEARAASFTVCSTGCDYSVIQDAVDAAGDGDVIKVAAGTYDDVNNHGGLVQVVYIVKSVTIQGGYTTAFTEPPDPVANPTTLDAKGLGRVIYIEGDIDPTIEGLRITGGDATIIGSEEGGGGVKIAGSAAILRNNEIYNNAAGTGGGVDMSDCAATLESNTIISNTANGGGGMWMYQCDNSTLSENIISFNTAYTQSGGLWSGGGSENIILNDNTFSSNNSGGWSGGLELQGQGYTLVGNTISSNSAPGMGGIFLLAGEFTLIHNDIISNTGGGVNLYNSQNSSFLGNNVSYNNGTGIYINGANIMVRGNTISHNNAEWGGGLNLTGDGIELRGNTIISNSATSNGGGLIVSGDIMLIGNTIASNNAGEGGGGIFLLECATALLGNTISSNTAGWGGGVQMGSGDYTLINNIITNNHADHSAGVLVGDSTVDFVHNTLASNHNTTGIGIWVGGSSVVTLTNTIIVSHPVGIEVDSGGIATIDSTLWGSGVWANGTDWQGGGTINHTHDYWGDPNFVDYLVGDYHIGENSAAIDAGIDAGVTTDIDFHPRPYLLPDIGADEYWPPGTLTFIYLPLVIK